MGVPSADDSLGLDHWADDTISPHEGSPGNRERLSPSFELPPTPAHSRRKNIAKSLLGHEEVLHEGKIPSEQSPRAQNGIELSPPATRRRSLAKSLLQATGASPGEDSPVSSTDSFSWGHRHSDGARSGLELTPLGSRSMSLRSVFGTRKEGPRDGEKSRTIWKVLPAFCLLTGLGIGIPLGIFIGSGQWRDWQHLAAAEPAITLSNIYRGKLFERASKSKSKSKPSALKEGDLEKTTLGKAGSSVVIPRVSGAAAGAAAVSPSAAMAAPRAGNQPGLRGASHSGYVQAPTGVKSAGASPSGAVAAERISQDSSSRRDLFKKLIPEIPPATGGVTNAGQTGGVNLPLPEEEEMPVPAAPQKQSSSRLSSKRDQLLGRRDMLHRAAAASAMASKLNDPWPAYLKSVAQAKMDGTNSTDSLPVPHLLDVQA